MKNFPKIYLFWSDSFKMETEISKYTIKCNFCEHEFDQNLYNNHVLSCILKLSEKKGSLGYNCKICDKVFKIKHILKTHVSVDHLGVKSVKNHECITCKKTYIRLDHLKSHMHNVHEGQKDQKCDFCQKSFFLKGHLNVHLRVVHEGQRAHKCNFCRKVFSRSDTLKQHTSSVHEGNHTWNCGGLAGGGQPP